ncbi:hypothetical protein ACFL6X_08035 [Candidatus Latescibacterota bacterium]
MRLIPARLRTLEIVAIATILVALGIVRFSRLSPAQAREADLRAGMEQLYQLEADHFRQHRRYFDPQSKERGAYLQWMEGYNCEIRWSATSFVVLIRADLDGDGEMGTWRIDQTAPDVVRLSED